MTDRKKRMLFGGMLLTAVLLVFGLLIWLSHRHQAGGGEPEAQQREEQQDERHDFTKLRLENSDIYAWLKVPGTKVDYPVLQAEEDNYYLTHNLDHSEGRPGCVYSNSCNTRDFSDAVTILYGHNMKNGTMFAGLHRFDDEEFFREHDVFTVETEDRIFRYQIFAVVNYNDDYIPAVFSVNDPQGASAFAESLLAYRDREITHIREGVSVTPEDRLVVLSTCITAEDNHRFLVVGKLME